MTRSMQLTRFALLVLSTAFLQSAFAQAVDGTDGRGLGVRAASGQGVHTAEFFVRWPAPFMQEHVVEPLLPAGGAAHWETALSYWAGGNDHATVFTVGPTLEYPLSGDRWRLSLGIQPTLFSDYASETRNLGGPFEFTSHIGVRWQSNMGWYVGARVQHTSNAGIYKSNPGIDLFAIEFGSRF